MLRSPPSLSGRTARLQFRSRAPPDCRLRAQQAVDSSNALRCPLYRHPCANSSILSFVRSFVVGLPCPPLLLPCAYLALLARRDNVLYRVCLAQPHSLTSSLLFTSSLTAILIFGALDYHRKRAGNISARLPANGSGGSLHLSSS